MAEIAAVQKIDAVINGGDMFPTGGNLLQQGKFISNFLDTHVAQFNSKKINRYFPFTAISTNHR